MTTALALMVQAVEPPPMQRPIAPDPQPPKGRKIPLADGDLKFSLFVPQTWKATDQTLTVHFHTAEWFVIQEYLRRGVTHPVAAFYLGDGSSRISRRV